MNTKRNLHRFAVFVCILTVLLIFAGGLVTSTGSGLAVPDWPLSFGKFFPEMKGGVAYEHGHRMFAGFVGLMTIILAIWLWRVESRKSVRWLGVAAVAAVFGQALLGGITVLLRLPLLVSVSHAAMAQLFLCLVVSIALVVSSEWQHSPVKLGDLPGIRTRTIAVLTTSMIFVQIMLGALMRHSGGGLSIPDFPLAFGRLVPPFFTFPVLFNYAHRIAGLVVILLVFWFSMRIFRIARSENTLRKPAFLLIGSLLLQVVLGAITIWARKAPIPTTLHVVCGALTLAISLLLALKAFRIVHPQPEADGIRAFAS